MDSSPSPAPCSRNKFRNKRRFLPAGTLAQAPTARGPDGGSPKVLRYSTANPCQFRKPEPGRDRGDALTTVAARFPACRSHERRAGRVQPVQRHIPLRLHARVSVTYPVQVAACHAEHLAHVGDARRFARTARHRDHQLVQPRHDLGRHLRPRPIGQALIPIGRDRS
jgi:hypothetical protein